MGHFKKLAKEEILSGDIEDNIHELYEALERIAEKTERITNITGLNSWVKFDRIIKKAVRNAVYTPIDKTDQRAQTAILEHAETILYFQLRHLMETDPNND